MSQEPPDFGSMQERMDDLRRRKAGGDKGGEPPTPPHVEPDANESSGPMEVNYLTIDPNSVSDSIELEPASQLASSHSDSKLRRFFWWAIGSYALLWGLDLSTEIGWLPFLIGLFLAFLLYVGYKVIGQNRRFGAIWLGATLLVTCSMLYVGTLVKPAKVSHQNGSDGGAYVKSLVKQGDDTYTCPHCKGLGIRYNEFKGDIAKCSSCGGDGIVTGEQYDRLRK